MDSIIDLLLSALRMGTPLWLAAMGGLLCERSGVVNLALEGFMLIGAFAAAATAYTTGNPWIGLMAGALAGSLIAALFAVLVLPLKGDQVVVGMGINLMALGVTPFLAKTFFNVTGSTPSLLIAQRFTYEPMLLALLIIGLITFWFHRLLSGLWVRFAGEEPFALTAAGIKVSRVRWIMILLSGLLAGMGGAALSTMLASQFSRAMTAGNGFIAVAAIILGGWRPLPTAAVCLLFGFIDAIQIRLQGWFSTSSFAWVVPLVQLLPYIVTLIVLAGFLRGIKAPAALGASEED